MIRHETGHAHGLERSADIHQYIRTRFAGPLVDALDLAEFAAIVEVYPFERCFYIGNIVRAVLDPQTQHILMLHIGDHEGGEDDIVNRVGPEKGLEPAPTHCTSIRPVRAGNVLLQIHGPALAGHRIECTVEVADRVGDGRFESRELDVELHAFQAERIPSDCA
jgi:hypothetical protein